MAETSGLREIVETPSEESLGSAPDVANDENVGTLLPSTMAVMKDIYKPTNGWLLPCRSWQSRLNP
jgi:hypothetical protein